jgi:N-acetylglucosamine-6-phosphate deacetylase
MTKIIRGCVDLHTHGIDRYDTKTENPGHILKMAELHGKAGTGAILPTIYPGPVEEMRTQMEVVRKGIELQGAQASKSSGLPVQQTSALILGVHLEGPFLNPEASGRFHLAGYLNFPCMSGRSIVYSCQPGHWQFWMQSQDYYPPL